MDAPLEITPRAAADKVDAAIIDVREPQEFAVARLEESELIPLNTLPGKLEYFRELAGQRPVLLLCHHGVRSLQAAVWLRGQGVENCFSIAGGIDRWSVEIDTEIPRY